MSPSFYQTSRECLPGRASQGSLNNPCFREGLTGHGGLVLGTCCESYLRVGKEPIVLSTLLSSWWMCDDRGENDKRWLDDGALGGHVGRTMRCMSSGLNLLSRSVGTQGTQPRIPLSAKCQNSGGLSGHSCHCHSCHDCHD